MTMLNTRTRLSDPFSRQHLAENDGRMITWYASLDGSLGKIVPVGEKVYKRLQLLQTLMQTHVSHIGGLNPKEYRSVSSLISILPTNSNGTLVSFKYSFLFESEPVSPDVAAFYYYYPQSLSCFFG